MDRHTQEQRSKNMAAVRGRGNFSTELALVKVFRKEGITGWRRQAKIFGKPDFVFPKKKVAVFVDGCFWHGCKKCRGIPKSNQIFWSRKIKINTRRDELVNRALRRNGWYVKRIWEHELRDHGLRKRLQDLRSGRAGVI